MPQLQPLCSAALVPNVLPRRDEGSGKPCALCWDRSLIVYQPLLRIRIRAAGFRIISGDHYTTTAHYSCFYCIHASSLDQCSRSKKPGQPSRRLVCHDHNNFGSLDVILRGWCHDYRCVFLLQNEYFQLVMTQFRTFIELFSTIICMQ